MSLFDSALRSAQAAINGGMRTTSTMQRPGDNAANTRARKRRRNRNGGGSNQLSAQDLIALWQSMPTPNRGFRRPGGDQPDFLGGGLDQFYAKNPGIAQGADRAGQIAAERKQQLSRGFEDGRAAVDFVKQTKGYTGADGVFVPPTMPAAPSSNYGTGSVAFTDKPTDGMMTDPLTGQPVRMDQYLPQQAAVSETKSGPMTNDITDPVTGVVKSYNDAGMDYFNPQKAQMPSAIPAPQPSAPQGAGIFDMMRQAKAAAPQNDMNALFPGAAPGPVGASAEATLPTNAQASAQGNFPQLTQNGAIPDLWDSGNSLLYGLGDLYSNNVGRPLDQFLFGIQPPAQPSNNMQQYQKSRGQKQGWW